MTQLADERYWPVNSVSNYHEIKDLVRRGALFYVSHSGGKDSQAMYALLRRLVPFSQMVVVHADLGEVEWRGVKTHIRNSIDHKLQVVRAVKTLFDMVERRAHKKPEVPSWPSSQYRQCTSDLKRGPIHKLIRNDMKARESLLSVNCMGLRSSESPARAKRPTLAINSLLSKAGRQVYDYLPIHHFTENEVFSVITRAGQKPFWAYAAGDTRLSCVFCIMGNDNDLRNGAKYRPELYRKYRELEERTGWTMFPNASLADRLHSTKQRPDCVA